MIFSEISKAIDHLFFAAIVIYIYNSALSSQFNWKKILGMGFIWCVGGALVLSLMLGKPTCLESEEDGRGGICLDYDNNGYKPTNEQYMAEFAFYFILSYTPVLLAANNRRRVNKDTHQY